MPTLPVRMTWVAPLPRRYPRGHIADHHYDAGRPARAVVFRFGTLEQRDAQRQPRPSGGIPGIELGSYTERKATPPERWYS